jgi:trehalose monomycolate/heme transporter
VLVGGLSADTVDLLSSIKSHLPWMAGIIIAVMMVLLFLAFGSLVLPLKAVVMNLLSISASFGVITWIFADGHLQGFLGYTSTGFLDATQPIFMLAILVGLSMDYEVFLLSRVREQWDKPHPGMSPSERNTDAVAVGLQKTGRIITSAALLLAVVIGAFSTSGIVFMKMIGVGMLVALIVDATVVRALLVPATMKLLGRWNWWAPGPLLRFWERYGIREVDAVPLAESQPTVGKVSV